MRSNPVSEGSKAFDPNIKIYERKLSVMTKDMTTGKIMPLLVKFTIPLVLGNLFQLTYNAVDSIIVGHFVGKEALAAVGICNPISTLMILFLNGLCMGASILMGMQYGAREYDTLHRQISTTMLSGVIFSVFLTLICVIFAVPILHLMQVDPSIMVMTTQYLRIIFVGLVFTFLYNFFSSTLRALGDSNSPLYFLIISAILNIFGDLFFVVVLHAGSNGCAVSTVISEVLCCLFCIIYIQKKVPILRLGKKWMVFDSSLLKKTIAYGWASAMQQATVQLGKLGIQAIVNTMGVSVAAAFAVVNRIDDFAYTPEQNIAHAMTALMAQNKGAGKKDRMREGFRCGLVLETIYGIAVFIVCFVFARHLMMLFVKDEEVISHGDQQFYQHGSSGSGCSSTGSDHAPWHRGSSILLSGRLGRNAGGGVTAADQNLPKAGLSQVLNFLNSCKNFNIANIS